MQQCGIQILGSSSDSSQGKTINGKSLLRLQSELPKTCGQELLPEL